MKLQMEEKERNRKATVKLTVERNLHFIRESKYQSLPVDMVIEILTKFFGKDGVREIILADYTPTVWIIYTIEESIPVNTDYSVGRMLTNMESHVDRVLEKVKSLLEEWDR